MLITSLTIQKLKALFPHAFLVRGSDYYHQNRVQGLKISQTKKQENTIYARVEGGNSAPYEVHVHISGSINKLYIRGICSCPMELNCKHVVATLLKAMEQIPSLISTSSDQTMRSTRAPITILQTPTTVQAQPIVPPKLAQDPNVGFWLSKLSTALSQEKTIGHNTDETFSLRYLLNTSSRGLNELKLTLVLVKWLKSGRLSAPKTFSETANSHQRHLLPVDKELLVKLEVARKLNHGIYYSYSDYYIKGPTFEKLLPELVTTGRCHWGEPNNPSLKLGPPEAATLAWQIDENGLQELRPEFSHSQKPLSIFFIDRIWYLNKDTVEIGLLETGLDTQVATLLLSAPKIPPESSKEVADLLMQDIRLATVARPKIFSTTKVEKVKPTFCLSLSQVSITVRGDYRQHYQLIQVIKPVATLTFKYKTIEIPWIDTRKIIRHVNGEQLIQFARDEAMESRAFNELAKLGLMLISSFQNLMDLTANSKFSHYFLIGDNPLNFSAHSLPLLRTNGWQIEIASDYPYQIVDEPINDWYSSIDEGASYDWFNLELGIIVNGEKINLLPVLHQLIKQLRIDNNPLDADRTEPVLAKLPDGRFVPLPIERVRNISNVLIELYDSESLTDEDFLRLSKLHASRLLELDAALGAAKLRWFGGEKLRQLGAKLLKFKGLKTIKVPKQFKGELRPYQRDGLNWLQFLREYKFGGILADDMGLGKTVQALSHITVEKISGRMEKPSLIIAPTSLMFNWRMEAERFVPHLKVLVLHGAERKQQFENISQYDLVLTTYPLLKHDKDILLKQDFYFLVLDEAQLIKNAKSLSAQIVQQIHAQHRLCLTGTPLENHLGELWSLFHFMMPGLLGDEKIFNRLFRTPIEKHGDQERREHLARRISPFLLRRTKNRVAKELPEKVNMIRHVEIDGAQRDLYETIRVTMQKKVRQEIAKLGLARSHIIILDALLKLRQVCCDPRLLKINTIKKNKATSAKLELLMTLLPKLIEEGRRILLFSQFTGMLELIENELKKEKITYLKLTGQTKDRATPVRMFQDGEIPLFLISLKAGGTGLNLTAADTVIHYDPWWNPAVEDQATDRAHRIGQDKTVFVYKFVTKGTVEEKILEMQENKRALMEGLFSGNTSGKLKLTEKDLQGFFEPLEMAT